MEQGARGMEPDLPQRRQGAKVFHSGSLSRRLISRKAEPSSGSRLWELSYIDSDLLPLAIFHCPRKLSVPRRVSGYTGRLRRIAESEAIGFGDAVEVPVGTARGSRERPSLGADQSSTLIDGRQRGMMPWKVEKRRGLIAYLVERGLLEDGPFWKLAQALFEVLPRDLED